ncbi:MAG: hypothetical protein K6F94_02510 [Bacteroidaceae bacterium]|nr:hypothetical protein [Bacteroidaceae bacterium]
MESPVSILLRSAVSGVASGMSCPRKRLLPQVRNWHLCSALLILLCCVMLLSSCGNQEDKLRWRAAELCKYIPDHELLESSKDYLTEDFYSVLDTMFNMSEHEPMEHEWLYYFVTGNSGTIADYEVVKVEQKDKDHAVATIRVRQKWDDGSIAEGSDFEDHLLYMERVDEDWLMADFDGHKSDCIRHIAINRREESIRKAISDYLMEQIGVDYLPGEVCIPSVGIVREEGADSAEAHVWGDFWVFNYNVEGDTLCVVSGGSHPGMMTLTREPGGWQVTAFRQVEDGARFNPTAMDIFGDYYDIFMNMSSNQDVREAIRKEQLSSYVRQHKLPVRFYKDHGWPAVEL